MTGGNLRISASGSRIRVMRVDSPSMTLLEKRGSSEDPVVAGRLKQVMSNRLKPIFAIMAHAYPYAS